jgi:hypothetical protein
MGRGEPGIGPGLTTQRSYFRQEICARQPSARAASQFLYFVALLRCGACGCRFSVFRLVDMLTDEGHHVDRSFDARQS